MTDPRLESLTEAVGAALRERGWTVAAAESCTGGLVTSLLTELPGSSDYVLGGVVAYADEVKEELLGVPGELLRSHGAVSGPVAEAMARGVRSLLGTEVGVAITGIAGPGGGSNEKPVGTVWFGVDGPHGSSTELRRFPGDRSQVRRAAVEHALTLLIQAARGR
jgi:PncC family amidohydrolase